MSKDNNRGSDAGLGCVFYMLMALVAMPIVGLMLLGRESDGEKMLGLALLIVGIILWVAVGCNS